MWNETRGHSRPTSARALALAVLAALGSFAFAASAASAASGLPDGRVYEMVSPPEKGGMDVRELHGDSRSSVDGNRITYVSYNKFPRTGGHGASTGPRYLAERTPGGWRTRAVDPPIGFISSEIGSGWLTNRLQIPQTFSADLEYSTPISLGMALTPDAPTDRSSLYKYSFTDDSFELVSKSLVGPLAPSAADAPQEHPFSRAVTDDLGHVVFQLGHPLTSDAGPDGIQLYEWDHGEVRLASVLPDGTAAPDPTLGFNASGAEIGEETRADKALSEDGSRIIFTADHLFDFGCFCRSGGKLYMRENGGTPDARTVWVSESEKSIPDPDPKPAAFRDASEDASRVFFTTSEQLVDEDVDESRDLYMYEVDAPDGEHLTRISRGPDTPAGEIANVQGVVGVSDDGGRVYFVTYGDLVPGAGLAFFLQLYMWEDGDLHHVGSMYPTDSEIEGTGCNPAYDACNWNQRSRAERNARVTPDGRYLLFSSVQDQAANGFSQTPTQLYLFDGETGESRCVSCVAAGAAATPHGVTAVYNMMKPPLMTNGYEPRVLVDGPDGIQVYFNTQTPLVQTDVNDKVDVYRYDHESATLALISSGRSPSDSWLAEAAPGGRDVFFLTRERLSKWDEDGALDLYDARVAGGLPGPPALVPVCRDDGCQPPPSKQPTRSAPASTRTADVPDSAAAPRPRAAFGRLGSAVAAALARNGRAAIPVAVNRAGSVSITARGRAAGKLRVLGRGSKRVSRAGTARVQLVLNSAARRKIARGARLRLSLALTFAGQARQRGSLILQARSRATDHSSRKGR